MSDERCGKAATAIRFWPGKEPDFVCDDHREDTEAIAEAIGMHRATLTMPFPRDPQILCACFAGRAQRVNVQMAGGKEADAE